MARLKLFIISDIHAGNANGQDTYVSNEPPPARLHLHPLNDLVALVEERRFSADYLVVPGDIANRADTSGLTYAWSKIQQLARSLGAKVVAAPGNHDVITRAPANDVREAIKNLLPSFPTGDALLDGRFWSDGYCIVEEDDHRFVLIDSTSDFPVHPGTFSTPEEKNSYLAALNQGGIPDPMLMSLEREIANMGRKLNILVLHHHPLEHQLRSHMRDWHGPMRNGGELSALLSNHPQVGRWLIIHGHKHIPQLVQDVRVSSSGPVVFCAASLGHHLWAPVTSFVSNQCHLLTVADDRVPGVGSFAGNVATFNWGYSVGWRLASRDSLHLPQMSGFGYIADTGELAATVKEKMEESAVPILRRSELEAHFPMLQFLAPRDRETFEDELELRGLVPESDSDGAIDQIAFGVEGGG